MKTKLSTNDLKKIISSYVSFLPSFIISLIAYLIAKIIKLKQLNDLIEANKHLQDIDFNNGALDYLNIKVKVVNEEAIPSMGSYIFVANHPLGAIESLALLQTVAKHLTSVKILARSYLTYLSNMNQLFIGVNNKPGIQSRTCAETIEKEFTSGTQIIYFPAGLCSRRIKGEIRDLAWQKNFITQSVKYKRDIIPIYVEGKNSNFFYWLSNFRKKIGLGNIEMVLLPSELFRQRNKTITLKIGKKIPYGTFTGSNEFVSQAKWANLVKEYLYENVAKL